MKKTNVMSLFNGMSFGAMALETLGIEVGNYYSSEIDKYANHATQVLFPNVIQLGDVTKWREWDIDWSSIDLLLAGFPCQAWSVAGKQEGDNDPRGALVHDLIDIWNEIKKHNPNIKFMFENVRMKKEFLDYINELFGVEPVCINSALVSAQNRVRYYWTNISKIEQPKDKGILLADIIEYGTCDATIMSEKFSTRQKGRKCLVDQPKEKAANLSANEYVKNGRQGDYIKCDKKGSQLVFLAGLDSGLRLNDGKKLSRNYREGYRIYSIHGKSATLTAQSKGGPGGFSGLYGEVKSGARRSRGDEIRQDSKANCLLSDGHQSRWLVKDDIFYRKLTVIECARLQTVPSRHIDTLLGAGISNTQLYKMLGNGWTHDVIVHIFKGLLND